MKKVLSWVGVFILLAIGLQVGINAAFTDTATEQHYNRLGLKSLCETIDANFATIEDGTQDIIVDELTVKNTLTAISTNGATTNVIITTDGVVDGATIGATTLTVAQGGSGAATFTDGGVLLGSGTSAFTAMAVLTDGQMIVGDGTTDPVAESGATLRTSIGVGTGDSPQFTGIELGHADDTTITRASAGVAQVEGKAIYVAGGTDVAVADGGTGIGSGTSGGVLAFTAAGTIASSGALTQYAPVIGGGAGVAPSTISVGTDNQVLKGATGAAPSFGSLTDADVPDAITVNDPDGAVTSSNGVFNGTMDVAGLSTLTGGFAADTVSGFGTWGYTGEHVEVPEDASGNTCAGLWEYFEIASDISAGKVMAGEHSRLVCRTAQTNQSTMVGTESQFRLRNVNIADGVHAGLWAYAEQSGTSVLSGNGTFDAISATVESEAGFEAGATEHVTGATLDSSIHGSATIDGSCNFTALYIKSNGKDWFDGIKITGVDNEIEGENGETLDNQTDGVWKSSGGIGIDGGAFYVQGTTLVFITSGNVTNVIDADLTTP